MKRMIIVKECKLEMGNGIGFIFELLFDLFYENIMIEFLLFYWIWNGI